MRFHQSRQMLKSLFFDIGRDARVESLLPFVAYHAFALQRQMQQGQAGGGRGQAGVQNRMVLVFRVYLGGSQPLSGLLDGHGKIEPGQAYRWKIWHRVLMVSLAMVPRGRHRRHHLRVLGAPCALAGGVPVLRGH